MPGQVDHDLGRRLGRFLGRLAGRGSGLGFGLLLVAALLLFGLKLGRGGEGERLLRGQADGVDLGRLVEIGLRLARSPGAADGAPEIAVREEVEPLAVGAPGGTVGIDAVVGQLRRLARFGLEEHDPAEQVAGSLDVGEPAAVGGPGQVVEHADVRDGDLPQGLLGDVEQPELVILVGEGDPLAVGGRDAVEADDLGPRRHLLGRAEAVGRDSVEFPFAGLVGEDHEALAVAEEARRPGPDAVLAADLDPAAVADGGDEDVAAGDEDDAVAVRRDVPGGQIVEGFRHPPLAHLVEVGGQGDGQGRIVPGADVENAEIGHELVGDAARVEARGAGVEALVGRVLLESAALEVHGPDVHGAVAVAQEIDPALPDHRVLARAGVVRGEGRGLVGPERVGPQVLGRAALVALGVAALEGETGEVERLARGVERSVGGLAERQEGLRVRGRVEDDELGVGQGRVFPGGVEDLAVRRPAGDGRRAARRRCGARAGRPRAASCRPRSGPRIGRRRPGSGRRARWPGSSPRPYATSGAGPSLP